MLDASNAPTNDGGPIVVHVRYSRSTCGGLLRGGRAGSTVAEETVVTAAGVAWNRGLRRRCVSCQFLPPFYGVGF